jgi:hypothetical protein
MFVPNTGAYFRYEISSVEIAVMADLRFPAAWQ